MKPNLWIGTQPEPDDRLKITVSAENKEAAMLVLRCKDDVWLAVTDLNTNTRYVVRRANCGLGCRCALELVPEPELKERYSRFETSFYAGE